MCFDPPHLPPPRDQVGSEVLPRSPTRRVSCPVTVSNRYRPVPLAKMMCRELGPHVGLSPSLEAIRVEPESRSRTATSNPPLRTLNPTFLPSGDQFGSVL